jgi:hypothetical protein
MTGMALQLVIHWTRLCQWRGAVGGGEVTWSAITSLNTPSTPVNIRHHSLSVADRPFQLLHVSPVVGFSGSQSIIETLWFYFALYLTIGCGRGGIEERYNFYNLGLRIKLPVLLVFQYNFTSSFLNNAPDRNVCLSYTDSLDCDESLKSCCICLANGCFRQPNTLILRFSPELGVPRPPQIAKIRK